MRKLLWASPGYRSVVIWVSDLTNGLKPECFSKAAKSKKKQELNCEACCSLNSEPLRIVVARILVLNSIYKKHTMKHSLNSLGEIFKPTKYGSDATWLGHAQFHIKWCFKDHQQKMAYPICLTDESVRYICFQYFSNNRNHLILERVPQLWIRIKKHTHAKE
jgi:hypothetical protein